MSELERRLLQAAQMRAATAATPDARPEIYGYAALFNTVSADLGGFVERIAPGAFTNALTADVRALINHNPNDVLGRTKSGTLQLTEDATGLAALIYPPDTQAARDLMISIQRHDVDQMSFAFRTLNDAWNKVDGQWVRTLLEVELYDVSVVTYPAYADTSAGVRSLDAARDELQKHQRRLDFMRRQRALQLLENNNG